MLPLILLFLPKQLSPFFLALVSHGEILPCSFRTRLRPRWIGGGVRDALVIYKMRNSLFRTQRNQLINFGRRPAKAGAIQKMRRRRIIPSITRQWLKHTKEKTLRDRNRFDELGRKGRGASVRCRGLVQRVLNQHDVAAGVPPAMELGRPARRSLCGPQ